MADNKEELETISWDLETVELIELIMVVGSYLFAGITLSSVETDVIDKLHMLLGEEKTLRETGIPVNEVIH